MPWSGPRWLKLLICLVARQFRVSTSQNILRFCINFAEGREANSWPYASLNTVIATGILKGYDQVGHKLHLSMHPITYAANLQNRGSTALRRRSSTLSTALMQTALTTLGCIGLSWFVLRHCSITYIDIKQTIKWTSVRTSVHSAPLVRPLTLWGLQMGDE